MNINSRPDRPRNIFPQQRTRTLKLDQFNATRLTFWRPGVRTPSWHSKTLPSRCNQSSDSSNQGIRELTLDCAGHPEQWPKERHLGHLLRRWGRRGWVLGWRTVAKEFDVHHSSRGSTHFQIGCVICSPFFRGVFIFSVDWKPRIHFWEVKNIVRLPQLPTRTTNWVVSKACCGDLLYRKKSGLSSLVRNSLSEASHLWWPDAPRG